MREELAIANRYGNVDLTRTKLGRRYVHFRGKRLQPLCRKLKIRYAEAVVEFEGESRYGWRAVTDGVVISVRSHTKLLEAIKQREERNPPEKREAARKRREQARAKRAEERLKKLREAGIYDPTSRTAKWFLRDDISELEARFIQFKTYYRHEHTDYEQTLASLKKQAQQLHGASRRMAYDFIQQDARGMATEHPIPSDWKEYLDTYDFPFPDIAEALANVLSSPEAAHPIWFCKAILAVKSQGVDLDNLSYEVIQEAIIDWWNERIDSTHSVADHSTLGEDMNDRNLRRATTRSKRLTKRDIMEGNLDMFRQLGLDKDDVEQMAEVVGLELDDLLLLHPSHVVVRLPTPAAPGRPGRRNETFDIAVFANERHPNMTWDEIYREWVRQFPDDKRVRNKESVREAHRRFFGDKAKARMRRK